MHSDAGSAHSRGMREYGVSHDGMGEMRVPGDAEDGGHTARAIEDFPIQRPARSSAAYSCVARTTKQVAAMEATAQKVIEGTYDDQFGIDKTSSGTSTNMNLNEVIGTGRRAPQRSHQSRAVQHRRVPFAMHVAAAEEIRERLLSAMPNLRASLEQKAREFHDVITTRPHPLARRRAHATGGRRCPATHVRSRPPANASRRRARASISCLLEVQ